MLTLYRVSSDLNSAGEQCGGVYYFKDKTLAERAAKKFETTVEKITSCDQTRTSDDWFYE